MDRVSAVVDGGVFWDREEWWEFSRVQFAMTKRIDFTFLVPWYDTLRSDNTNHSKQRRRALSNICTNLLCYTSLLNIYIHTILFLHAKV